MNTSTPNSQPSASGGIHRGVWIGGGLMALTIVALATTLVVKNSDALPDAAAGGTTASAMTTTGQPAVATLAAAQPTANTGNAPANESSRPVRHTAPAHHEAGRDEPSRQVAAAPVCQTCGVIEGYSAVKVQGQNNGVGAVAGGLGGALVGSKIGGRGNHTLGGVVGAIGGGLLGNAIESHERTATEYDVRVRMDDGSTRTVRQAAMPNVGQHVSVDGHTLRAIDGQG